ncbi:CocE/NonD family hydrolase [Rhodococcus sp. JS3073]|uniref:CocE/NonD family hydrolase n=1 Tax=Rhodococcus sp. JS3073 TaxID=3002901 RepID=UPI002286597F|nr:CocE/NonD family hydrolase [Rhodococcus sp. JS3073]WAM12069.1 CocE/NonD family hydrolase [Rhodococcus sp. JS3073]
MFEFTAIDSSLAMSDGVPLAFTLYLPVTGGPVPVLLEALPYRKDDLLERVHYERFCTEFGFAVCRVDVRGTGSSGGLATDEYPLSELDDMASLIEWLAGQEWSNGSVGMFGWSYSGFNSLQVAAARPAALKAIVPIYSSDDRFNDDVHYMGGAMRALDLVDYPSFMIAMNAMPPVPSLWDGDWREEWRHRIESNEPWVFTWRSEQRRQPYWQDGSVRPDYARVTCPTMIVAGWADGYRNNTFRTVEALENAGTPWKLLIGPWSHMGAELSLPGPWIDLTAEMARWFDRWLRDEQNGIDAEPQVTIFHRRSTAPEPDLRELNGTWRDHIGLPLADTKTLDFDLGTGCVTHAVIGDVGTAAWNSCAGSLPWGQPTDQRYDNAASMTWDWPADDLHLYGHPRLQLRVRADQPVAFVSAKLCDVAPDGTASLITRGLLNLTHRGGYDSDPVALEPGEWVDVEIELEATAWSLDEGRQLRLAVTGNDWPNVTAPPRPVTLEIDREASNLLLSVMESIDDLPESTLPHVHPESLQTGDGVTWRVERDVLARTTTCRTAHGSRWTSTKGFACSEEYSGEVTLDLRTFDQRIEAFARFEVDYPEGRTATQSTMTVTTSPTHFDLDVTVEAFDDGEPFAQKHWHHTVRRDLA